MKTLIAGIIAATGLISVNVASAAEMPDLAKKAGCTACHKIDSKVVGPAWKEVAAKYKGEGNAIETISQSISKGSSGKWGSMPMPANPKLSADETKSLATFIMGLSK